MLKTKQFDCVKMKQDIQRKILEEFQNVPENQARQIKRRQIEQDPVLGPFLRRLRKTRRKRSD